MGYPGLFNSSYHPSPLEEFYISTPTNQLGPVLTGEIVVILLQGVMIVQYWEYVRDFWGENRWTRWLVHATFVLCLLKFGYVLWLSWDRFVPHYGDWAYLATFSPLAVPIGISSTIPSAVCQVFFIHRCWALSRNLFFTIPAVISLLVTVASGCALTYGAAAAAGGNVTVTKLILTSINVSLSSALVCDVFITTFTCYYLIREKTGFKETDGLVMRLVKCSIESALGPTIFALVNLILSNMATDNQWFLFPNLALAHVYGCSLLYSMNARRTVAHGSQSSSGGLYTRSKPHTPGRSSDFPMQARPKPEVYVEVQRAVQEEDSLGEVLHQERSVELHKKQRSHDDYMSSKKPGFYV